MKNILEFNINDKEIQFLINTDEKLGYLIKYIGNVKLELEKDGFQCIVKYVIGQQISDKARETIWRRLCNLCKEVKPVEVLNQTQEDLRGIGLSNRKIECIRLFSSYLMNKKIEFKKFEVLSNEEIINSLTFVKGIGRWTAEMYIIFSLGRVDVLSKSDGTIRRSIQWMYNLKKLPSEKEIACYFKKWKNYETIVSIYFWKSISLGLQRVPFNVIFLEGGSLHDHKT